ncbi:MAG: trypsin-like peptidase domain-containing protein [Planctomycetes bacterium]|nr:trypsin-like peptidase domain-containing protein [Planctomycetota bacterium]
MTFSWRAFAMRVDSRSSLPAAVAALLVVLCAGPWVSQARAQANKASVRVAAEAALGGITVEQQAAQQAALRAELVAGLPEGTLEAPIRVELTPQDRADLGEPADRQGQAPLRVGVVKAILPAIEVANGKGLDRGVVEKQDDGTSVWALSMTAPEAQAIRLHFTNFSLPTGAKMYFFSTTSQAHGPFVGAGRGGTGEFWTRSIAGETGVIVLRFKEADRDKISFSIADLGYVKGRGPQPDEQSHDDWPCSDNAPCVVDANCVSGTPADVAMDAVAKMEWIQGPFIYTCSGGLVADTDPGTQIPYFLTANHCLSSNNSSLETFFFYTTDACNGGCPDGLATGGTPPPASTIGVTVMATGSAGDFTLLQLDEAPPAGTTYLGWNNSPVAFTHGAALYRISNPNFGPQAYSQHSVDASAPTCTSWPRGQRIYSNDEVGATMGGSSGSPVLNSAGEVVGQLSGCCGFNCGNVCDSASNSTVDGALAFYWDSVAEFLDPDVGCTTDPDCDDLDACTDDVCSGGVCSNTPISCPVGEVCVAGVCEPDVCDHDLTCDVGEDCLNCPDDCPSGSGASCGNGVCEAGDGEDCVSCPDDCNGKQNGRPSGRFCCGDGDGQNPADCNDSVCTSDGFACTDVPAVGSCCGDAVCEGSEDGFNCEIDCGPPPVCGDGNCDPGEDQCSCATDCGDPPAGETICNDGFDEDCDGLTDCNDPDCDGDPVCVIACDGDGVCESGEDCLTCPSDCSGKTNGQPWNRYCCGDGIPQDPEGDGAICDGNY